MICAVPIRLIFYLTQKDLPKLLGVTHSSPLVVSPPLSSILSEVVDQGQLALLLHPLLALMPFAGICT
jgi:hypothetical protein